MAAASITAALVVFVPIAAARRTSTGALPASAVGTPVVTGSRRHVFPLHTSSDGRYLVDQRGRPFMIVGDSPQALIGKLTVQDAASFIDNRRRAGFNALWVDLLCASYTGCHSDGTTFDGIPPFTRQGDLATPNPTYFARAEAILALAAKANMVVFLDPIETGGWLDVLRSNGVDKARSFGRYLGRRFRGFPNIVWSNGNDFQTWKDPRDDALVLAVSDGIRSTDRRNLQTVELNYFRSGSLDDERWRSRIDLDGAYTYFPTYAQVLEEYNRRRHLPVYMAEAGYEFEQNNSTISKGDPPILRRQEYWSALSGAAGQFYGNHYTWQFADGWRDHLDTAGSAQLGYLVKLFRRRPWFRLVPDRRHVVVTGGFGAFRTGGNVASSDYVTTAATPDRTLAISYLPNGGTVKVALSAFRHEMTAHWYDPTSGKYSSRSRELPLARRTVALTAPGDNAEGGSDWVLVLTMRGRP